MIDVTEVLEAGVADAGVVDTDTFVADLFVDAALDAGVLTEAGPALDVTDAAGEQIPADVGPDIWPDIGPVCPQATTKTLLISNLQRMMSALTLNCLGRAEVDGGLPDAAGPVDGAIEDTWASVDGALPVPDAGLDATPDLFGTKPALEDSVFVYNARDLYMVQSFVSQMANWIGCEHAVVVIFKPNACVAPAGADGWREAGMLIRGASTDGTAIYLPADLSCGDLNIIDALSTGVFESDYFGQDDGVSGGDLDVFMPLMDAIKTLLSDLAK
ncbi:MAG: hypothetical protein JRH20_27795 [Deltaproteobacteria bacterium]|nr:hypothetical protein [Deltaproteobacteria bacterium]